MDNIYTNNIQNISTANVSLYTGYTGNIFMGDINTNILLLDSKNSKLSSVNDTTIESGGEIYLNSNGNTQICNTGFGGKLVLSGNQEIRAKDRSAKSYLFTDAFTGGDVEFGNASTTLFIDSLIKTTTINTTTINTSTLNASTANISTLNVSTKNASTINATTINASTLNASTTNAINTNASYISCQELYTDYAELGNIAFSNETISTIAPASTTITMFPTLTTGGIDFGKNMTTGTTTIGSSTSTTKIGNFNISANQIGITSPSATIDLFPTLTTGTLNICTNATSAGAITIGQAAATGSFSVSEGTININAKTTLNMGNQLTTGTIVMGNQMTTGSYSLCNTSLFRGTLNIASDPHLTDTNTIRIGNTQSTINMNSATLNLFATGLITSSSQHKFNGGITFNNSNFNADKIVYGRITTTNAIGGNGITQQTHTFPNSFPAAPPCITISIFKDNNDANIIPTITAISTTGFTTSLRCTTNTGVSANTYDIMYIVIGNAV
jgi:hypothetical protein